jgi:hypothetical protein
MCAGNRKGVAAQARLQILLLELAGSTRLLAAARLHNADERRAHHQPLI